MDFKFFQPTLDLLELRRLVKSGASLPKTVGRGRFAGEEELPTSQVPALQRASEQKQI